MTVVGDARVVGNVVRVKHERIDVLHLLGALGVDVDWRLGITSEAGLRPVVLVCKFVCICPLHVLSLKGLSLK